MPIKKKKKKKKKKERRRKKENGLSANEFTKRLDLLCSELIGTDSRH